MCLGSVEIAEKRRTDAYDPRRPLMKKNRWLGLPAVAILAVIVFAVTAGIGSARTAVAPKNTTPPSISGKAQVGQTLSGSNGTWSGTTPLTYAYQWRICGTQ